MAKMKEWFLDHFLPMWAKEMVLSENRQLRRQVAELEKELNEKNAYINGLMAGIKSHRKIVINTPREEKK